MHNVPSYFLWSALTSCLAVAQSPFFARPERVLAGAFPNEPLESSGVPPGLGGATLSPDGRLLLSARNGNPGQTSPYDIQGWLVTCFRPEVVITDSRGIAQFPSSVAAPPSGPWSAAAKVDTNVATPISGVHSVDRKQFTMRGVSMCPDPYKRHMPCPFPSNSAGVPGQPGTAGGSWDTYMMMVVGQDDWPDVDPGIPNDFDWPRFRPGSGIQVMPIGMRFLRVTVENPRTTAAKPSTCSLTTDFEVLKWTSASLGEMPVLGIEPSLSLDGRLLVFQGNVSNNTRPWNTADFEGNQVMYTFNPVPGVRTGWSEPHPINEMSSREQNTLVNGVPFARLYPIAAAPMTMADGAPLTQGLAGAYPWMTLDATDFVFSAFGSPIQARRFGMSIVGRSTGFSVRYIDGPLNPDRYATLRIITTGTGAAPGIWAWGGDTPGLKLPYTRRGTSIPLLHMQQREYAEICVNEAVDGDYLLAWDMNEFLQEDATLGWRLDLTRTPDTSGHGITGDLFPQEAQFPEDRVSDPDPSPYPGPSGQFIVCTDLGAVRARGAIAVLNASLPAMTAECWFWRTPNGLPFLLIHKAGAYELIADRQGLVMAQVTTALGTLQSPWLGPSVPMGAQEWRHVAMTYDGATGRFCVYLNGGMVHEQFGASNAQVAASSSTLVVGPAGFSGGGGLVGIDQVRLSRVERTADEIARAAFAIPASSGLQSLPSDLALGLPLGLDPVETKVPASNIPSRDAIDLGETLFHDPRLSGNGQVSCATCHISTPPSFSFTDGIAERPGFASGRPLRNAPTVLNRVFSTEQFWDGRAKDLEAQAIVPLFGPEEMGADIASVLNHLSTSTSPDYNSMFSTAYAGAAPSIELLQDALGSYQRALVAGDSPADRYEAGVGTLSASAERGRHLFFGKARCFGCHSGSNYSDERYHISLAPGGDVGRYGFTGRTRDDRRFKTPTLRNLGDTAPYFHRGQAATLADVIDLYNAGGTTLAGVDEEIFPLGLTPGDKADLQAFLLTLSGGWQKL